MDEEIIVAEAAGSDDDEAYDTGSDSDLTTLSSSVLDYQYENGRRYHGYKSGKYYMPNDEAEQDRLDMLHHVFSILLDGRSYLAPLKDPQKILDIGTGTGIWALDMAEEFPMAEVIGTDLSPIQPTWVFPNVQFLVDDAEANWVYPKDSFHYIHLRNLGGSIQNWSRLLKLAYAHIKPGEYLEVVDFPSFFPSCDDETYTESTHNWRYYDLINKASSKRGKPLTFETSIPDMVTEAGFEVVLTKTMKLPMGMWPADKKQKELGKWMQLISRTGFEAYGLALFTRELGMSKEEAEELIEGCKKEMATRKIHIYFPVQHVVGRKPFPKSDL